MKTNFESNHKIFLQAILDFFDNPQRFRRILNNKNLSIQEKNILKAKRAIKKNSFKEALDLISFVPESDYLKAHILLVKGTVLNNSSQSHFAIDPLKQAIKIFKKELDHYHEFYSYNSLIFTHINRKEVDQAYSILNEIKKVEKLSNYQKSCILRAEALIDSMRNKDSEALDKINKAMELKSKKLENQIAFFYLTKLTIEFKMKRYKECEETLLKYKKSNGYFLSANYLFINSLLTNYLYDKPIYLYPRQFIDNPELFLQVETIKALIADEKTSALKFWKELQDINKSLYLDNFKFNGEYCLFKACLEKHSYMNKSPLEDFNLVGTTQEKLIQALKQSNHPISKENLIKAIWNEEFSLESSNRLNTLVYRVKKNHGHNIRSRKGAYKLIG